jgi:hypothetical protein
MRISAQQIDLADQMPKQHRDFERKKKKMMRWLLDDLTLKIGGFRGRWQT